MNKLNYLIIGGDSRQAYLTNELIEDGNNVSVIFGNDFDDLLIKPVNDQVWVKALEENDILIFPLPISKDNINLNSNKYIGLEEIISKIKSNKIIMGGGISNEVKEIFKKYNLTVIDYLDREELAVLNAIPTAEGAIEIAMKELPITIYNSKCLVTGFGRISKILVRMLKGIGADVTVVARKHSDLVWAETYGAKVGYMCNINNMVKNKDIIFNTVPAKIIDENVLNEINSHCLIIDVASKPGGVDFDKAKTLNIKTIWALALPGKVAPKTSGKVIKTAITNIIDELKINK